MLDLLVAKYGPTLTLGQLAEVLHMSLKGVYNAVSAETFPVRTYRAGKRRLANATDVANYLEQCE